MSTWTLAAPTPSDLGDHDVVSDGCHLAGRRVALLVTGGIAAMKIPLVARALRREGAQVVAFTSKEALRYVTAEALEWSTVHPIVQRLTAAAEHLSDSAPFDAYLLAPATYNSLNKIATGIADGVVTSAAASALGRLEQGRTAVLCAPTMHGSLHNRILVDSLRRLHALGVRVIPPRDAYGKHNLPDEQTLVAEVARAVSRSPLRGRRVLCTGGAMAGPIDSGLQLLPSGPADLGLAIAWELHLRGADVTLIQGDAAGAVPASLPQRVARTSDDYRNQVHQELGPSPFAAVFAATVADYQPAPTAPGSLASGLPHLLLSLVPTPQLAEQVQAAHPGLFLIALQSGAGIAAAQLLEVARGRLARVPCVLAHRGAPPSPGPGAPPQAWLVTRDAEPQPLGNQRAIVLAIADRLEKAVGD